MGEVTDPTCDSWATVDFGRGPVDIRCTQPGVHDKDSCMCVVFMVHPGEEPNVPGITDAVENAAETNGAEG